MTAIITVIFNVFVTEAPDEPILAKFCMSRDMADEITCAHFGVYELWG